MDKKNEVFELSNYYGTAIYVKSLNNHFQNILRLFDILPSFSFTTSETRRNKHDIHDLPHELSNNLRYTTRLKQLEQLRSSH